MRRVESIDPFDVLPKVMTVVEISRLLRVNRSTVMELANRGIVVRAAQKGRFETLASVDRYIKHLRDQAAGRASGDGGKNLAEERAETERIVRAREKIKLDRELGEVITRAEAIETWSSLTAKYRAGVLAAKTKIGFLLPHLTAVDRENVGEVLREILIDLAQEMEGDLPPGADTNTVMDAATEEQLRAS